MTEKEASQLLGLSPEAGASDIKKRYRQLICAVHPDSGAAKSVHDAQKLNAAYSLLKKRAVHGPLGTGSHPYSKEQDGSGFQSDAKAAKPAAWDAPVNPHAYREREILHNAEDQDGTVLGAFCIAKGKYLWSLQEDFPLFQLSIYRCSALILDEIDRSLSRNAPFIRQRVQAELSYFLAQQFIDAAASLKKLAREERTDSAGRTIYRFSAMLEYEKTAQHGRTALPRLGPLADQEPLYPAALRRHRLYLKNGAGKELGYLSFPDDRLYYIVIPLFEQKRAQVRIEADSREGSVKRPVSGYQGLKLWLRFSEENRSGLPENLSLRIERLLDSYRKAGK